MSSNGEPFAYYGLTLTDPVEKAAYDTINQGLAGFCKSFRVPELPMTKLSEIFSKVRLDHPLLMNARTFSKRSVNRDYCKIIPEYRKENAEAVLQAALVRLNRILRPAAGMSDSEKIHFVHDYILQNVRYDKLKKQYSHEATGPLQLGIGVCEGIAKACKAMFDFLCVDSLVVLGEASETENIRLRHAWNVVYLAGIPYHFDATFDLTLSDCGLMRHDYELLSTREIMQDHQSLIYPVPECPDGTLNYYDFHGQVLTEADRLPEVLTRVKKRNLPGIVLKIGHTVDWTALLPAAQIWTEQDRQKTCVKLFFNVPQRVTAFVFTEKSSGQSFR